MLSEIRFDRHQSVRDRVLALRSLESFSNQSDLALSMMAEHAVFRHFERGQLLLEEGRPLASVFIVLAGVVRVTQAGRHVALVERGSGVGFLSVLARDEVGVTAEALEPSDALEVPVDALLDASEEHFALMRNGLRLMAEELVHQRTSLPIEPDRAPAAEIGTRPLRPPTLTERVMQARQGTLFENCNMDAVVELMRRGRDVEYTAGEILWQRGVDATFYLRIEYGIVECAAADGRTVTVGSGFTLGIHDCLAQAERGYTATAQTDIVGFKMDIEALLGVLESHYELARDFQALLAQRLLEGN